MDVEKGVKKKKMNRFESVKLCHLLIYNKKRKKKLPFSLFGWLELILLSSRTME